MEKLEPELKTLSLTGRLCYLFMCIEKYLTLCYSEKEWVLVAKRCWQWTNVYWNEGCDRYSVVVPEYLFEFEDYEKTNTLVFDGKLSQNEAQYFFSICIYCSKYDSRSKKWLGKLYRQ